MTRARCLLSAWVADRASHGGLAGGISGRERINIKVIFSRKGIFSERGTMRYDWLKHLVQIYNHCQKPGTMVTMGLLWQVVACSKCARNNPSSFFYLSVSHPFLPRLHQLWCLRLLTPLPNLTFNLFLIFFKKHKTFVFRVFAGNNCFHSWYLLTNANL